MPNQNIHAVINLLIQVREITSSHLPIGHSFIPYEMMLIVVSHYISQEELTVKRLFNSGEFSEMGNRYHFRRLIEKDFIVLKNHPNDSRLKLILPSQKLLDCFDQVSKQLFDTFLTISKQYLGLELVLPKDLPLSS
jgi:hypothetical protein